MVAGTLWLLFPKTVLLLERWQNLNEEKKQLKLLQDKKVFLESLNEQELADKLKQLETIVPPEKNVLPVFADINGLGGQFGVSVGNINLNPGQLSDIDTTIEHLSFSVSFLLPESSLVPLIKAIYSTAPLFSIDNVSIGIFPGHEAQIDLPLTTYFQGYPKTFADSKTPLTPLSVKQKELLATIADWKTYPSLDLVSFEATASAKRKTPFNF